MSKVLMVLGMHRSGTSMLAQWLSACGFNLGDRLQGITFSNKFGHFEDSDFYQFHNRILKDNHTSYILSLKKKIRISPKRVEEAKQIIESKNKYEQWGWKEPRTCLFVDLWDELLPDAYSIIIYRHFDEVADSLYRRESSFKKPVPKVRIPARILEMISYRVRKGYHYNKFLQTHIRYNQELLEYVKKKNGNNKILLFSLDDLINSSDFIYDTLTKKWGFKLKESKLSDVFSKEALTRNDKLSYHYDPALIKMADDIMQEFEELKEKLNAE